MERYPNIKLTTEINFYYVKNSVKSWTKKSFLEIYPKKQAVLEERRKKCLFETKMSRILRYL